MKQILVIEDNMTILNALLIMLKRNFREYNFLAAHNGLEGLQMLRESAVDLIITDLNMPVMDGYEFLSLSTKLFPEIPVFAMTAETHDAGLELRLLEFGVSKVFYKPFDVGDLSSAIREVATANWRPAALSELKDPGGRSACLTAAPALRP